MDSRATTLATLGGITAVVLWSTTVAFARSLSEQIGPVTAAAAVYLVGGGVVFSVSWLSPSRRLSSSDTSRQSKKYLFGCGSMFVLYTALLFIAIGLARDREQVLQVGLLNYLWPPLTIVLSIVLLRTRANVILVPGILLALFGTVLVMSDGRTVLWRSFIDQARSNPAAYGLGAAAAGSWALYSVLTRRWAGRQTTGAAPLFILVTGVVLLGLRAAFPEQGRWTLRSIGEVIFLGVVTGLAYQFWDIAMRRGSLILVVVCSYFTPLLSTLVSSIYLQVTPTSRLWLGAGLLVIGSLISWWSVSSRGRPSPLARKSPHNAEPRGDTVLR
jgi:drug/metabolite transporter (DMT)-like permease